MIQALERAIVERGSILQMLTWGLLVVLLVFIAFLSLVSPWYYLAILSFLLLSFTLIVIRFRLGVYFSLLLVPVNAAFIGIFIEQPWNPKIGGSWTNSIPLCAPFVLVTAASLIFSRVAKLREPIWVALHSAFYVLLAYGAILMVCSEDVLHSLFQMSILIMNMLLFLAIVNAADDEVTYKRLIGIVMFIGFLISATAISLNFFSHAIEYKHEMAKNILFKIDILAGSMSPTGEIRRASSFTTTHETGLIMNMIIAIAFGLYLNEKKKWRKIGLLAVCIGFLAITLLTMSRGVLIALVAMGFFLIFMTKSLRKRFFLNSFLFISALAFTLIFESITLNYIFKSESFGDIRLIKVISDSLKMDEETGKSMTDAPGRMKMWKKGFKDLSHISFVGLGPGNFKYYARAPHAHSVYFSFLFDFGLLGLLLFIYVLIISASYIFNTIMFQETYFQIMSVAIAGGLVAVGVHSLVDFEYNTTSIWVYAALAVATIKHARNEINVKNKIGLI